MSKRKNPALPPHPMQPVYLDDGRTVRFRENAIVRYIVDHAGDLVHPGAATIDPATGRPYHQGRLDLSKLTDLDFPQEDREQFAQLMGYTITGYHELSYVSDASCEEASALAEQVLPDVNGGCRDVGCPVHDGPLFDDDGRRIT